MSKRIEWTTDSGNAVCIELQTERVINADGDTATVPDWSLYCRAGAHNLYNPTIKAHATAGDCIVSGGVWVPIPADMVASVAALLAEHRAEVVRRNATNEAAYLEHEAGHARVLRAMGA